MKINNLKSSISELKNPRLENKTNLAQGVAKRLLEKYKPKGLYKINTISERKGQRKEA
tara:strand:- start:834 stop:1007 length:174 start_codon:yes stop_codon:yes gene_type:complete